MQLTSVALFGAILSLSIQVSSAQSTSSASATTTATSATASSSLIPTGISQSCSDFLTSLNSDTNIKACTAPLLSATQYYANATEAASNSKSGKNVTTSADALESSLGQLCADATGCQPDVIRTQLSKFWNACSPELKAKNEGVIAVYDVLYLINPFHDAVCTKDDSNNYCVLSIANNTATQEASTSAATGATKRSLLSHHANLLHHDKRQTTNDSASAAADEIDSDSLNNSNIAFLFLQPSSSKEILCSSCSKNVLAAYIQFETSIPYSIGLSNSENLKGQSELYKAMQQTCGASFTTSINEKAGTTAFAEVGAAMGLAPARIGAALGAASLLAGAFLHN